MWDVIPRPESVDEGRDMYGDYTPAALRTHSGSLGTLERDAQWCHRLMLRRLARQQAIGGGAGPGCPRPCIGVPQGALPGILCGRQRWGASPHSSGGCPWRQPFAKAEEAPTPGPPCLVFAVTMLVRLCTLCNVVAMDLAQKLT